MTEIFYIFFQLVIFISLFSLNIFFFQRNLLKVLNLSFYENLTLNVLFQINLVLFLSLFNLNFEKIVFTYLTIVLIIFILNIFNWEFLLSSIKKINYKIFLLSFVCFVIFIDIAFNLTLSWDTSKFWFNKTLNFYNSNSISNLENIARPHYPHLGTLLWATFWKISFLTHEYSGRLFFAFIYALSIFLIFENLNSSRIIKAILSIFVFLITYDYLLIASGNQEIIIFALICFSMNSFYKLSLRIKINENLNIILILLVCNSLIWIKLEGAIYSFILILTLIFFFNLSFKKKFLIFLRYLFFYLTKIFIYKLYNFEITLNPCCYNDLSFSGIANKITIDRILIIFKFLLFSLFKNYLILIGAILLIICCFDTKLIVKIRYIYFYAIINFLFVFLAYLFADYDIVFMLKTGIDRLIFSFSPFIILLLIEYLNSKKLNFYK